MESRLVILALFAAAAAPFAAGNTLIVSNQPQDYFVDDPITEILTEGMELALKHCQLQFHQDPWNCPIKDFVAKQQQNPTLDRESAFVQSITVAAIAYTLAKNCSGVGKEKSSFCQCAFKDMNGVKDVYDCFSSIEDTENELTSQIISKLSGGDQVAYDPQGMMRLQNSRAGLYTVMNSVQKTCRCHGFSGSCSISTCWMALDSFSRIASDLKKSYIFAEPLDMRNSMNMDHIVLTDGEMVYLDQSPNYCGSAKRTSWESVRGRRCATSLSTDEEKTACKGLCSDCGLRMKWKEVMTKRSCNCKFHLWRVYCDQCEELIKEFYCV